MYCPLPFNHLSIEPNGGVSPCCNTSATKVLGNSNNQSLMTLFDGEELKAFREQFLLEETPLPPECFQCQKIEEAGNLSLRQTAAKMYPMESLKESGKYAIRYLGLRFDNTCNLKCRICFPNLSSAWVGDYQALGRGVPKGPLKAFPSKNEFLSQIDEILDTVTQVYVAGGEPFLSPLLYELMNELKRRGREQEVEFAFNTNATITQFKGVSLEKYFEGFKSVSLGLSLDGVYKQAEYLRHGSSWENFHNTIKTYKSWDNAKVFVSPTLGNLNFYYLPELLKYCLKDIGLSPQSIVLGPIFEPKYFQLSQFPEEFKPTLHKKLLSYGLELIDDPQLDKRDALQLFQQIKGMIHLSKKPFDPEIHKEFIDEVKAIDKLRGESFDKVFPELGKIMKMP